MAKLDLPKLYQTQISQSEWLEAIGHDQAEAFRHEDNEKRQRLAVLNELTGMPFDKPVQFPAIEVTSKTAAFQAFCQEWSGRTCAIRLLPNDPKLPKLRMRGLPLEEALRWYAKQDIEPSNYRADFLPHSNRQDWSTVFVVNKFGAFGEIIPGSATQVTQGFYEDQPPIRFDWDYEAVKMSRPNQKAELHVKEILGWLKVQDAKVRRALHDKLGAKFYRDTLQGYFETTSSVDYNGLNYVDYNRILGDMYADFKPQQDSTSRALVTGQSGSAGVATGLVRVTSDPNDPHFEDGEVLVCPMTTPDFVPLMRRSSAVVTDLGGILSHAAIVARELHKPCLTATGNATSALKTGQRVLVDAGLGEVRAAAK